MTGAQPPDPDFLAWPPPVPPSAVGSPLDSLGEALDACLRAIADVRASGADPGPRRLAGLRQAEQTVHECLRSRGWCSGTAGPESRVPDKRSPGTLAGRAGTDLNRLPSQTASALVDMLAIADRDCGELVERIGRADDPSCAGLLRPAQRCRGLIADALLVGAVELAVRMGVSDRQLPL